MEVREGFVESGGHQLAYLAVNEHLATDDAPAIVFIHGVLASVNFWRDCVPPAFREGRAWYALSLPAHHPSTVPADFAMGDVDADWFFRTMDTALKALLGERKAIIVGHSTGGFCAVNLAIHHSENVAGIVSVAGFHRGVWGGVEGMLLKIAGWGRLARPLFVSNIRIAQLSGFVRRIFTSLLAHDPRAFRRNPLSQRTLENIELNVLGQDAGALFILFNGITGIEVADQLGQITMPCHIFYGTHDPVVPATQSRVLATGIPGARAVAFEQVGHMPFMEDTDTYYQALEAALEDLASRTDTDTDTHGRDS